MICWESREIILKLAKNYPGVDCYFSGGIKDSDYNTAPCEIAMLGHLVIKTIEDVKMIVCYLPEIVTDKQYEFIYNNQDMFLNNIQNGGYSLRNNEFVEINGMDNLMREINKKNMLYGKVDKGVKGV